MNAGRGDSAAEHYERSSGFWRSLLTITKQQTIPLTHSQSHTSVHEHDSFMSTLRTPSLTSSQANHLGNSSGRVDGREAHHGLVETGLTVTTLKQNESTEDWSTLSDHSSRQLRRVETAEPWKFFYKPGRPAHTLYTSLRPNTSHGTSIDAPDWSKPALHGGQ